MSAKAVREDDAAEQFEGVGLGGFEIRAIAELPSLTRKVADLMVVGAYGEEFSGTLGLGCSGAGFCCGDW